MDQLSHLCSYVQASVASGAHACTEIAIGYCTELIASYVAKNHCVNSYTKQPVLPHQQLELTKFSLKDRTNRHCYAFHNFYTQ